MAVGRAERLVLLAVGAVVALVGIEVASDRAGRAIAAAAAATARPRAAEVAAVVPAGAPHEPSADVAQPVVVIDTVREVAPAPRRDSAELRARIITGAPGTYLVHMAAEQGEMLIRWPERRMDALRVWVEPESPLAGFSRAYAEMARESFGTWVRSGSPLRFSFVVDTADVDIRVRWIDQFPPAAGKQIGVTRRGHDVHGWLARAEIIVALRDRSGRTLSPEELAGVVRHEVGHALGLGHAPDTTSIMYPRQHALTIAPADLLTLRLLYTLPPGRLVR